MFTLATEHSKARPKRNIRGMFKCNLHNCRACPFIKEGKTIKKRSKIAWQLNKKFSCNTFNVIYMIECQKDRCKKRYIGHTKRKLKKRLAEHRGYVINRKDGRVTGSHFNSRGHSVSDLAITVLEIVESNKIEFLEERERFFIQKFNTIIEGLNEKL